MLNGSIIFRFSLVILVFSTFYLYHCISSKLESQAKLKMRVDPPTVVYINNTCIQSGCFDEICSDTPVITNPFECRWKEEFICRAYSECKLIDGTCQWEKTKESEDCLTALSVEDDCIVSGCYGEVCSDVKYEATEEKCKLEAWKPEYDCFRFATCGKINGICSWTSHAYYSSCYQEALRSNVAWRFNSTTTNSTGYDA